MTPRRKEILAHALGGGQRNYFASNSEADTYYDCWALVESGHMTPGKTMPESMGSMEYFHVTDLGREALAATEPK